MTQDPNPAFQEIYEHLRREPGVILFTALRWLPGPSVLRRVSTSHPVDYPLGAEKSVEISEGWLDTVIANQRPFLAPDAAALAEVFTDVALIQSLGCGAVINIPVTSHGEVVGVLALLDAEGQYTGHSLDAASAAVSAASERLAAAFIDSDQTITTGKDAVLP
ncbi:GAF domain-containing protein [Pseudarthrobacter sp. AG30]|uniref:GAF domain-containing protein n=1 Tax=unclassified Pseudarthrobacter TaxID=2647000 RepID=UPI000D64430D|nr:MULTISPECIES: GAF domain-containing protein [unclassified Pseudarthrobacter]RAX16572.1 GAF domain-containing protein [Pseudarthrobacter sp. AG30]